MRPIAILALAASLSACVAATPIAGGPRGMCSDAALGQFIGQPATQELGTRMLAASGAHMLRWVTMGMMVTMEYRGDRLNVHLGPSHQVLAANCG